MDNEITSTLLRLSGAGVVEVFIDTGKLVEFSPNVCWEIESAEKEFIFKKHPINICKQNPLNKHTESGDVLSVSVPVFDLLAVLN